MKLATTTALIGLCAYQSAALPSSFQVPQATGRDPGVTIPDSTPARCNGSGTLRVLFIGNSYTYVNNVPVMVEQIAASLPGPCVQTAMIATGGATLHAHWADTTSRQRISGERWTHVVLQDQSTFGEQWWVDGRFRVGDSFAELSDYGTRFARHIQSAGAIPVFLSHWADDGAPARDQQALDFAFDSVARATGSGLAPVGAAIKAMAGDRRWPGPYHPDGHHLSPAGSYMESLVLYAAIADRSTGGATAHIRGPAVDFQRGVVHRDSLGLLVDMTDGSASSLQRLADSIHKSRRGARRPVQRPEPLRSEFPEVPSAGERIELSSMNGRWLGSTSVLPAPPGQQMTAELVLHGQISGVSDSIYLRVAQMEYAGAVTTASDGTTLAITGSVIPRGRIGRSGAASPFSMDVRVRRFGAVLQGVATMHQAGTLIMPSLDAVGRFEVRLTP